MKYSPKIIIILIVLGFLQGCANPKIHREVLGDALLKSTDAFKKTSVEV